MTEASSRPYLLLRVLSAVALVLVGVIHLVLVFAGTGGVLGVMFVLNGVAGVVLAVAMLALRGTLLRWASVLGLLFLLASLAALLLSLTVGLLGITEVWSGNLVVQTVVVEAIGIVLTAVTTAALLRARR